MLIVLNAEAVEDVFRRLNLPFAFSEEERVLPITMPVVDEGWRVLGFVTPKANRGLNILNLRQLLGVSPRKPPSFFDHPWYLEEAFGLTDCAPGWHFIQMDILPGSLEQPYHYIDSLSSQGLALPTAIEVVLMLFLQFVQTGEQLLLKKHTWCQDSASLGRFVTVGAFGRNGVFISGHPETFASRGLGICGKLKRD
jgi:hypothetical protein